jgi:hypothetical protein
MIMKMQLEIDTEDRKLGFDLVGTSNSLSPGTKVEIPGSAILTFDGLIGRKAFGFPVTLEFILTFSSGVSAGIVANWLYEKIKGRALKLRIDRTEVQINKGEIERIIFEKIEKSE